MGPAPPPCRQGQAGPREASWQPGAASPHPVRPLLRPPPARPSSPPLPACAPDQHHHPERGERGPGRARPAGQVRQSGLGRQPGPRGAQGTEGERRGPRGALQKPLRRLLGGPQETPAQQRLLPDPALRHRVRQPLRPLQHVHRQVLLLRARHLLLRAQCAHLEPEGDLPAHRAQRAGGRHPLRPAERPQHHAEPEPHAGAAGAGRGLGAALQGRARERRLQRRVRHLRHLHRLPGQVRRGALSRIRWGSPEPDPAGSPEPDPVGSPELDPVGEP